MTLNENLERLRRERDARNVKVKNEEVVENTENTRETYPEDLFDFDWKRCTIGGTNVVELFKEAFYALTDDLKDLTEDEPNISITAGQLFSKAGIEDITDLLYEVTDDETSMIKLIDREGRNWLYYCLCTALEEIENNEGVDMEIVENVVLPTREDIKNTVHIIRNTADEFGKFNFFKAFGVDSIVNKLLDDMTPDTEDLSLAILVDNAIKNYEIVISIPDDEEFEDDDEYDDEYEDVDDGPADKDEETPEPKVESREVKPTRIYDINERRNKMSTALRDLFSEFDSILNR